MSSALEKRYLQDGYILASLLDSNNSTKYGTAYVQIRQSLIIENIYVQGAIPQLTLDDVAAWAGIKPATYANNRTFANNARATLQYLRAHANSPGVNAQSNDNRRKEEELLKFLSKCFLPNLITGDSESSPEALTISSTTVATVKKRMEQFQHPSVAYRGQRFTTVEALQSVPL
jgi:hypothetical protein